MMVVMRETFEIGNVSSQGLVYSIVFICLHLSLELCKIY